MAKVDQETIDKYTEFALRNGGSVRNAAGELLTADYLPSAPPPDDDEDETPFQNLIVKEAKRNRWESYHTKDSRKSRKGWPDLALWRERFILVECKTEKGKLTADQKTCIETLIAAGVTVYVWRPSMWAEILKVLR